MTNSNHHHETQHPSNAVSLNFIEQIIENDLKDGKNTIVHTRFPPEPNGYLHLGHATSICLNYGLAAKYKGKFNLRFDDTNPDAEDIEYVDSIRDDAHWLGAEWDEREFYASDYFEKMYQFARQLIAAGKAYVDFSSAEEIALLKGTPTQAGTASQYRHTTPDENLELFAQMRAGKFEPGECVLRAKMDLASPNMHLRDPLMYRIKKAHHHQTGDEWCIYPMYDYAHPISDSLEGITYSLCTLEFEVHRPAYEWYLRELGIFPSRQIEFARRNLNYTIMSKRYLKRLVTEQYVNGWDDPRMPTVAGVRRRGYTAEAIRQFAAKAGISKRENVTDIALLEACVRDHLNSIATRVMVVSKPIKLIITNYPATQTELLATENNPEQADAGTHISPFGAELYIEQDDFMENPPKKYFRLSLGGMVRLKSAYIVQCNEVLKDAEGNISAVLCTYLPNSKSGDDQSGVKVKGTIHWVSAAHALPIEVRLYDRLFSNEDPSSQEGDFVQYLNPHSLQIATAYAEPYLQNASLTDRFQFIRKGYFCLDKDSTPQKMVFNQTVGLKDSFNNK